MLDGLWMTSDGLYEEWIVVTEDSIIGRVYKDIDNPDDMLESLVAFAKGDSVYYGATVMNQNNGSEILFSCTEFTDRCMTFENKEHDFPQRIEYCRVYPDTLQVKVSNPGGKGFQIHYVKQSN